VTESIFIRMTLAGVASATPSSTLSAIRMPGTVRFRAAAATQAQRPAALVNKGFIIGPGNQR
jgi:hypothetical protein